VEEAEPKLRHVGEGFSVRLGHVRGKMERATEHPGTEGGQLAELLACERALEDKLSRAREEAAAIVAGARAEASRVSAEAEASLRAELDLMRSELLQRTEQRIREVRGRAGERARALEEVTKETVERLADAAFRELIGGGPA